MLLESCLANDGENARESYLPDSITHCPKHRGPLYGPPVSAVRADLDPNP